MTTVIHSRVEACRSGDYPKTICRMASGWAVLGDVQFLPGYSLLLPDPVPGQLNDLTLDQRAAVMRDATLLGDALLAVTGAARINYEILGNLEPALHVHVFPRFTDEPEELRTKPVWLYDWDAGPQFDATKDAPIMARIRAWLEQAGATVGD